ncbi:TonB-dependent receptor plug domain-containing protein [Candidatus Margulisiibacteriota bacterium]
MLKFVTVFSILFSFVFIQNLSAKDIPIITLDKTIVTARKVPYGINKTPANTTIITKEQIENSTANDVNEILEKTPGLAVDGQMGGTGRGGQIQVQASDSRHTRIMVDGILLNNQLSGIGLPFQIPLNIIDHIEIIKGGASSVWGSSLGGIINIITKKSEKEDFFNGFIEGQYGSYNTYGWTFNVSGKSNNVDYLLSGNLHNSDGFRPKAEMDEDKFYSKFILGNIGPLKTTLSIGHSVADYNNFELFGSYSDQNYKNTYSSLRFDYLNLKDIELSITLKYMNMDTIVNGYNATSNILQYSFDSTQNNWGLEILSAFNVFQKSKLVFGGDIFRSAFTDESTSINKNIEDLALFTNFSTPVLNGELNAGARYEKSQEFGYQISPSVGYVRPLPFLANTLFRINLENSFHVPPVSWKYIGPSPDLKPERAWTLQTGIETLFSRSLKTKLNMFYSYINDVIEVNRTTRISSNIGFHKKQGVEAEVQYNILNDLLISGSLVLSEVRDRSTNAIVLGRPVQTYNLGLNYNNKNLGLNLDLSGRYIWWNIDTSNGPNDRKFIWDMKYSQFLTKKQDLKVFFSVYNLLNEQFWQISIFPMPERHIKGGINWQF